MKVHKPARFQVWMLVDATDWVDVRYIDATRLGMRTLVDQYDMCIGCIDL